MSLQVVIIICSVTLISSVLGLLGLWHPQVLTVLFLLLTISTLKAFGHFVRVYISQKKNLFHAIILLVLIFMVFFHFIGVLTPETGFDALWYHLPLIQRYSHYQRLIFVSDYYQSLYPQFADSLIVTGYTVFGVAGAKLVSYLFFLLLLIFCFEWLRSKQSVSYSILGVLVVGMFQVVSWQSSSVYVDLISTVFFLWAIRYLLRREIFVHINLEFIVSAISSGIFFGAKFINLGFLPLFLSLSLIPLFFQNKNKHKKQLIFHFFLYWLIITGLVLPWHLRAWWESGKLFFPVGTVYAIPVITQMGVSGWKQWLMLRFRSLWRLPFDFFFRNDGYVTPLLFLFFPITLNQLKKSRELFLGVSIGIYGLLFWYFFPPPSTRYVLGCIIVFWLVIWQSAIKVMSVHEKIIRITKILVLGNVVIFMLLRIFVVSRAVPYLSGIETQNQYLDRFRNGFLDEKIDSFYSSTRLQ